MKTSIIFADVETSCLPSDYKAPSSDPSWPHIVQIAAQLWSFDAEHNTKQLLQVFCYLIKPDGYEITEDVQKLHGIDAQTAAKHGVPLYDALSHFMAMQAQADYCCFHNASFDSKVIRANAYRCNAFSGITKIPTICTMMTTTKWCDLTGPRGRKWPRLNELYGKLFNEEPANQHDAHGDVTATVRCFFRLFSIGVYTQQTFDEAIEQKKKIEAAVVAKAERLAKEAEVETTTTNKE